MKPTSELIATIANALDAGNLAADGQTDDSNYVKSGREALAELAQRVADLEAAIKPFVAVMQFPLFKAPITDGKHRLTPADWKRLKELANRD